MSDQSQPPSDAAGFAARAPSLLVTPRHVDFRRRPGRRMGPPEAYGGDVGVSTAQQLLLEGCQALRSELEVGVDRPGRAAAKIGLAQLGLHEARMAKSYRPLETFAQDTCPIIGETDSYGNLLVLVTPTGLEQLERRITAPPTTTAAANLSSVASFAPLNAHYRLTVPMEQAIHHHLLRDGGVRVKVRLPRFELFTAVYQEELEAQFLALEGVHQTPYLTLGNFLIYGAEVYSIEQVNHLAALPFIDRVEVMPRYRPAQLVSLDDAANQPGPPVQLGPIPGDLPTVVIADTGIARTSPLAALVRASASFVADATDPAHGTAVAALAATQRDTIASGAPTPRAMLVDARIFTTAGEDVFEEDMIPRIEQAVRHFGPRWKVWNASIASVPGPRLARYSELGQRLDELRHEYGLMFVCAAGNLEPPNFRRTFPPVSDDDDWIYAPGDSTRNLTATSLAPEGAPPDAYARPHEPSPFVGRGLTPAGALLPLVAEYGGNVTSSGKLIGIPTLDVYGRVRQMAGSSMTAPLIAGTLAELEQCLARSVTHSDPDSDIDPLLLAKTIMLHRATVPTLLAGSANLAEYMGFGVLPAMEDLTDDPPWQGTTLIATTLAPNGEDLVIDHLPFPDALRFGDHCHGEILLTLVTEPRLASGKMLEYVRSDVEVQLGPAVTGADGEIHIAPNKLVLDTRSPAALFESERIKREQKWSPFRRYCVRLPGAGIRAERWALRAHLGLRAEESDEVRAARDDRRHPQRFTDLVEMYRIEIAVAISIVDPHQRAAVREQLRHLWQLRGDVPAQIAVDARIRSRFRAQ